VASAALGSLISLPVVGRNAQTAVIAHCTFGGQGLVPG
jgi:hypothetical protein